MVYRIEIFCIILYIVILLKIVLESLGILVSSGFIFSFYIFVYLNEQASLYHCRSPPIGSNFQKFVLIGGFFMIDKALARFIRYMEVVLYHRRVEYIENLLKIGENEEELQDYKMNKFDEIKLNEKYLLDFNVLNNKEKQLLELVYVKGFVYVSMM